MQKATVPRLLDWLHVSFFYHSALLWDIYSVKLTAITYFSIASSHVSTRVWSP